MRPSPVTHHPTPSSSCCSLLSLPVLPWWPGPRILGDREILPALHCVRRPSPVARIRSGKQRRESVEQRHHVSLRRLPVGLLGLHASAGLHFSRGRGIPPHRRQGRLGSLLVLIISDVYVSSVWMTVCVPPMKFRSTTVSRIAGRPVP